jgi:type 1 fimbria pilin
MKLKSLIAISVIMASVTFVACKKESGTTSFRVRLTDAPAQVEEVNIDLREVQVKFSQSSDTSSSNNGWTTLTTTPGVYNLLDFQNGLDTLIAQGNLPTGQFVKEIRLILDSNNTIKVDSSVYPLRIPSGAESGLKIKISKKLQGDLDSVVIDFDAALSIRQEANGYMLRPVVRIK